MFASRLKKPRLERNLSQAQLAEKMNTLQQTIGKYESGVNSPKIEALASFADFFNVTVDYLLGRVDDPTMTSEDLLRALHSIPDLSKSYDTEDVSKKLKEVLKIKNPFKNMSQDTRFFLENYHAHVDSTAKALKILLERMREDSR